MSWRREFVRSFVERDLPQFGSLVSASTISRFWAMLAHYHGQIWNASEFARAFGVSEASVRRYADLQNGIRALALKRVLRDLKPLR